MSAPDRACLPIGALCWALAACSTLPASSGSVGGGADNSGAQNSGGADPGVPEPGGNSSGAASAGGSGSTAMPNPRVGFAWQVEDGVRRAKADAVPDDVTEWFDSDARSGELRITYPLMDTATGEGTIYPMNSPVLEVYVERGEDTPRFFLLEFSGDDGTSYELYPEPCDLAVCVISVPETELLYLGQELAGSGANLTVYASSGPEGDGNDDEGDVVQSNVVPIRFSSEPLEGTVYYRTTGEPSIRRAAYGTTGKAVSFIAPESETTEFACVACHAVSRNGSVIAFAVTSEGLDGAGDSVGGQDIAAIQLAPTNAPNDPFVAPKLGVSPYAGTPEAKGLTQGPFTDLGHNVALSPDGSRAAVNGVTPPHGDGRAWPPYVEIRDTASGVTLQHWDAGDPLFGDTFGLPIHPEWSPDGTKLAFTLAGNGDEACVWTTATCHGEIVVFDVGADGMLSAPVRIARAPEGRSNYYPTWAPGGDWLAFVSAPTPGPGYAPGEGTFNNPDGALYLVAATADHICPGDCIELASASLGRRGEHISWPKFAPNALDDGGLLYLTFSANFAYGRTEGRSQLWTTGIDVSRASEGQDPSSAPFWMTFQDDGDASLTPYWSNISGCAVADGRLTCSGCVESEECLVDRAASRCSCVSTSDR